MQVHDQRFKILIREFFVEFLFLFFASWAERFDFSTIEWLDKEIFPDPPQGDRTILDLVAKLATKQSVAAQHAGEKETWLALVHIEIESPDKATPLRPKMHRSYNGLRERYGLQVLPIGVFLQVALDGVGVDLYVERFWELDVATFQYLYVGLPGLDAIQYVQGDNWLGVALSALMKIPKEKVAWLGAEALERLQTAPLSDQKRFLLGECVQAYLPLDEEQQREYETLLATEKYAGALAMNKTPYEKGLEQGEEKGEEKGRRSTLREQLEDRFGTLSPAVVERLQQLSRAELLQLSTAIMRVQSLSELGLDKEQSRQS